MRKGEIISSIILILFSLIFMAQSKKLSGMGVIGGELTLGADFLPFWLSIIMLILSIFLFLSGILLHTEGKTRILLPEYMGWKRIFYIVAGLFGYLLILERIGFALSTFIFLILTMILLERHKSLIAFIVSVLVTSGLYLLFKLWLKAPLPEGIFGI